jgi:hypothetical protein
MKKLLLVLVLATGCASVPADVVASIATLRKHTGKVGKSYVTLLEKQPVPPPKEGETAEKAAKAWADHLEHQRMLVETNDVLAERVHRWAQVSSEQEPEEKPEE